jgi:hypothetical protein
LDYTRRKLQETKIERAGMKCLTGVADYIRRAEYHVPRIEDKRITENVIINPKRRRNIGLQQLRSRDKHTAEEDGTDRPWPNPR